MNVDDDNSIYVGGLHYNATEDTVRSVFGPYASIVAVKIINDHSTRGKCYGFVTFRNPRSVISAINDMNGNKKNDFDMGKLVVKYSIDGRVVRVNGATRGRRSNFSREGFPRRNTERGLDWDRDRDRERDYDLRRDGYQERYSNRSRERDHDKSWDHEEDRERVYEHTCDHEEASDCFLDRDQSREKDMVDNEEKRRRKNDWDWERSHDFAWDEDQEVDGINGDHKIVVKDTNKHSRKLNGSSRSNQRGREISSDPSDNYNGEVREKLERSIQRHDELKNEMEERLEDKQQLVLDLQKKAKKLEAVVITAKKLSSWHRMQLNKLQNFFLQVKEYGDKLKSSEQGLQSLVDLAMIESDVGYDVGTRTLVQGM